jgi:hypothetical protein
MLLRKEIAVSLTVSSYWNTSFLPRKRYGGNFVKRILAKRYQQEPWAPDPRMREVQQDTHLAELDRSAKYFVYHLTLCAKIK